MENKKRYSVLAYDKDNDTDRELDSSNDIDKAIKMADSYIPMLIKDEVVVHHGEPADWLVVVDNEKRETVWASYDHMEAYV